MFACFSEGPGGQTAVLNNAFSRTTPYIKQKPRMPDVDVEAVLGVLRQKMEVLPDRRR